MRLQVINVRKGDPVDPIDAATSDSKVNIPTMKL